MDPVARVLLVVEPAFGEGVVREHQGELIFARVPEAGELFVAESELAVIVGVGGSMTSTSPTTEIDSPNVARRQLPAPSHTTIGEPSRTRSTRWKW